jgi:DNA-directed RNA polymerase
MENRVSITGGYYRLPAPLIAGNDSGSQHQATPSAGVLAALNAIQATPWKINTFVLDVQRQVLANGDKLGAFPSADPIPLPELDREAFARLAKEERAAVLGERAQIYEANRARQIKAESVGRVHLIAERFAAEPEIYFPWQIDVRGRYLPVPTELHPQGHESARALLQFPHARKLDSDGEYWLAVGLANAFGQDKLPLEARVAWTQQHHQLILNSVADPLDGERLWSHAEQPWTFLALARDYARGVSQSPVCLDCSCSGVQHLAALSRDLEVAKQVNLVAGARADLYAAVALEVGRAVTTRALAGDDMATPWVNQITRATLKQPTMTLAYGATCSGRHNQLLPFAVPLFTGDGGAAFRAAFWLVKVIEEVLDKRLTGPMQLLRYFSRIGKLIAREGRAVKWTAPSGLQIHQQYVRTAAVRVQTLAGKLQFRVNKPDKADIRQTANATAPNVVHSLDASHLTAMVLAMGDAALQVVHDSAGTYATDVGRLAQVARDTFAEQYSNPVLQDWHEQQVQQHPDLASEFPPLPELGGWNPDAVRDSTYFFA